MLSLIAGTIEESKLENGKIVYNCYFLNNQINKKCSTKSQMLDFLTEHAEGLLETNEVSSLDFQYLNLEKVEHFLLIKKNSKQEITIHEETLYEYHKSHCYMYPRDVNRRVLNERSYSFLDIIRISTNFRRFYEWIHFLIMALLMILAVYSLIAAISYSESGNSGRVLYLEFVLTNFISIIVFFGLCSVYLYNYNSQRNRKIIRNKELYDWRRDLKMRKYIRSFIILILISNILVMFFYVHNFLRIENDLESQNVLAAFLNLIFLSLVLILELVTSLIIAINLRRNFKKYYANLAYKDFRKWKNKKNDHNVNVNMQSIFLFRPSKSEHLITSEMQFASKLQSNASWQERNEFVARRLNNLHRASDIYLKKVERLNAAKKLVNKN